MKVDTSSSPTRQPSTNKKRPVSSAVPREEEEPIRLTRPQKDPNKPEKPPKKPQRTPNSSNHNHDRHHDNAEAKEYSKLGYDDIELGTAVPAKTAETKPADRTSRTPKSTSNNIEKDKKDSKGDSNRVVSTASRFKGANPLQYLLWAHFMAYGSAAMCICMGIFAIAWTDAETYGCRIDGQLISSKFLFDSTGSCPTQYTRPSGEIVDVCCQFHSKSDLEGFAGMGALYLAYGIFILLYENVDFGYGLWYPNDTFFYRNRISLMGIIHFLVGVAGLSNYATCMPGGFLITTAVVTQYGVYRNESGDGGRETKKKNAAKAKAEAVDKSFAEKMKENWLWLISFNPITFYRRIYNEDKLSSYLWIGIYVLVNVLLFVYTLDVWYEIVEGMRNSLLDGSIEVTCLDLMCHVNRKAVKYGPVSLVAPLAKGAGVCLNLNCALLLLPVVRMLIKKLHNYGSSFSSKQQGNDILNRFFAHPLTRYLPLQKNIEFHKICAVVIFFLTWLHMICHFINLIVANNVTLRLFRFAGWDPTDWLTGAIATYAMFMIFSAAPDVVRFSKFEIFFRAHHFFVLFFLSLFLHGPTFFYWTAIPVFLYILERYMQGQRGNRPYLVVKAEYIAPVLALYFRPLNKEDFIFKEGQYLYLNCPAISASEWHPFTISSATDDLTTNPCRIHLETGEEVIEVPRPKNLPTGTKWNKYCLVSQDWQRMDPNDYLDKSETGYYDYISLHIKVHGLDEPHARTWTRKLKEYLELLSPGKKFPFYFSRRDGRGDMVIGRQYGPDGKTPILRVDGPHSAPAEHYANYGTLMLIGAGIGLTPCVSILTALTKYRWRKNFNPEILHFYWVIRQSEVESFQWLVHLLTENSYELKRARATNQIDRRYYCEINIYVTGVDNKKGLIEGQPLFRPKRILQSNQQVTPTFTADALYAQMLNPTVDSKGQIKKMKDGHPENRLQDVWVWNGRPHWDEIFKEMRDQRQHSDIGVCFCGAPAIGADLRTMCEKYSSVDEDCLFSLHKENF